MQKNLSQTLSTKNNIAVCIGGYGKVGSTGQYHLQNRIYKGDITISVTSNFNPYYKNDLSIRKLTPKECWRLMGFDDEDFEKASKVNSNTQLYKQAGNSIVVNVLEAILQNLLLDKKVSGTQVQTTIFDFIGENNE